MSSEDYFQSPPGNPEWEFYPSAFKNAVDGKFQRGIRLREEKDRQAANDLESLRASLRRA